MATAGKTVYSHITKDPEVCGGRACIDGTRIRVMDVASLQRRGYSPDRILEAHPSLNLAQVHAALSYFYENTPEIEAAFDEDQKAGEGIERHRAGFLKQSPTR